MDNEKVVPSEGSDDEQTHKTSQKIEKNGEEIVRHENGQINYICNYKNGKLDGREIEFTFYRNDALRITNWKMGKNTVCTASAI